MKMLIYPGGEKFFLVWEGENYGQEIRSSRIFDAVVVGPSMDVNKEGFRIYNLRLCVLR